MPVIHTAWLQGLPLAPRLISTCIRRWRDLNPEYDVVCYDEAQASRIIPRAFNLNAPHVVRSELLRLALLAEEGGIWVDATVLPLRPLREWYRSHPEAEGLFAFERPGPDRLLSSWFLSAHQHSRLFRVWRAEADSYWDRDRHCIVGSDLSPFPEHPITAVDRVARASDTYPYFWMHYLFARIVEGHPAHRLTWKHSPKRPSADAHRLHVLLRHVPAPSADQLAEACHASPVQKLSWRQPEAERLAASGALDSV